MIAATSRLALFVAIGWMLCAPGTAAGGAPADSLDGISAPALIDRVLHAYGGRAALDRIKAYRMEGRIEATLQGRAGPTLRLFGRPDRLRVELRYPESPELRILNGTHGWRGTGNSISGANGPMLDAMLLQAARAGIPWILLERPGDVRRIAPIDHRGRRLLGLEITLGEGLTLRMFIDPDNDHVLLSQGFLERGPMHTAFETAYGDFRTVDGVLVAFREENFASGQHTGDTTFTRIEWNPKLHVEDFAPPPGKNRS